ncbi:MAG: outer membrane protein transport protein [Nitrospirae bacterium]|nr:outer membrane protein transport protein [Nitrospirota bacterium]
MTTRTRTLRRLYLAALFVAGAALSFPASTLAAGIDIGASPNPVGSGARATGMGGAFIAVADDATAASWNPAGLVQIERPEVSAVGGFSSRREVFKSATHPELDGGNGTTAADINYLSAACPFTVMDRNVVASLNFQRLYDMNTDFSGSFREVLGVAPFTITTDTEQTWKTRGGLSTVSPALAIQITPALSAGVTVNRWANPFEDNGWVAESSGSYNVTFFFPPGLSGTFSNKDENEFSGTNFNVGLMYNPTANLTLAGVYKSGFTASIERTRRGYDSLAAPGGFSSNDRLYLSMPQSYGLGVAYRHSDTLTAALDVYRTEWSEYMQDEDGVKTRPNIKKAESASTVDATTQVRLGGEYLFVRDKYVIPVRAGAFYDPEPSENSPNTFFGFSAGSGLTLDRVALDFSYTFRTGKSGEALGVGGTHSDIQQHSVMVSAIVYL